MLRVRSEGEMKSFNQRGVWRKAHEVVLEIYKVSEKFRLADQLCRAATSIPANIVEGKGRNSLEYGQFLYTARASLAVTKYHPVLAKDLAYLNSNICENSKARCNQIGKMLNGLIKPLKTTGGK